jgi:hypothetical protein
MTANSFIDIDSVQNWCLENGMLLNVSKTRCSNLLVRSQYIKNLGVPLVCEVYIYRHVEYILSQGLKNIRFESLYYRFFLCVLYTTHVRPKLEYGFGAWNFTTSTDSHKHTLFQAEAYLCPFLINAFNNKICCPSIFDAVNVWIPTRLTLL